jgi:dihydrolipoamide dehydrogenase
MADTDFDVIVIGSGPGGYVAAIRAAQLGLKTACVESRETLGGTCLNVGCIPSKALLHASELFEEAAHGTLAKWGVKLGSVELDSGYHARRRREAGEGLTGGIEFLFRKNKVTWLKGHGRFTSPNSIDVAGTEYRAKNIVIATGSSVTPLPGVEIDQERIVDSTGALELPQVPNRSSSSAAESSGSSSVRLASPRREGHRRRISGPDPARDGRRGPQGSGQDLQEAGLRASHLHQGDEAERTEGGVTLTVEPAKGGEAQTIEADVVLVAIGRRPNTDGLGLEAAGVKVNNRGQIEVDHDFRTGIPGVYAIGDVVPGPMLAHKAEDEGVAVAEILAGQVGIINHDVIPSVVYTYPEIAAVGRTEEDLRAEGIEIKTGKFPMMANSRAKTNRDADGFVKVISDARSDRVLGVHIIASLAGTMIAQAAQAMEFGATSEDIAYTCHAHPTHAEAMKEAAMAVTGLPIHI